MDDGAMGIRFVGKSLTKEKLEDMNYASSLSKEPSAHGVCAGDYDGDKYEKEVERADLMMKDAIPFLEKVLENAPDDKSTLTVLKSIYFTIDDMPNYTKVNDKLKSM